MNIFVIPSWYPSESNPIYGTFVQEQCRLFAIHQPDSQQGVSRWGQGDDRFLLWSGQPVNSLTKLFSKRGYSTEQPLPNLTEYLDPAFVWTRKLGHGNIAGIIESCEANYRKFVVEQGKVDILHAQASYPGAIAAQHLSEKFGIPYVVTIRMSPFPFLEFQTSTGHLSQLLDAPLRGAGRLIATSTSLRKRLGEFDLVHADVIHNPVDIDFFTPSIPLKREHLRLVAIGRLVPQKGFDLLIDAAARLVGQVEFELRIIGDGDERENLEKKIRDQRLEEKVRLVGQASRSVVRDELHQSDALVLSSRHETFGNVVLEAMACGLPVVATCCGGPEDILTETCGILVKNEDAEALAEGVMELAGKEWDHSEIRQHVLDHFSPLAWSQSLRALYQEVITTYKG